MTRPLATLVYWRACRVLDTSRVPECIRIAYDTLCDLARRQDAIGRAAIGKVARFHQLYFRSAA